MIALILSRYPWFEFFALDDDVSWTTVRDVKAFVSTQAVLTLTTRLSIVAIIFFAPSSGVQGWSAR